MGTKAIIKLYYYLEFFILLFISLTRFTNLIKKIIQVNIELFFSVNPINVINSLINPYIKEIQDKY